MRRAGLPARMTGPGAGSALCWIAAMRGYRSACLPVLLLCTLATLAGEPPKPPFIERTLVVAPLRVGDFVLEGSHYDPGNRFAGVSLRYFLPGREEARIDLFVYPHGQNDAEAALDQGMRDFHATLEAAEQAGYYRDLEVGAAREFDIPLPVVAPGAPDTADSPGTAQAQVPAAAGAGPQEAGRAAMLSALLGADRRVDGRMIELAYNYPGQAEDEWLPMHSRGYLLYRHLHFFKGRISAAGSRIDQAAFAALADRAMRELVPAVQAYNIGSCGDTTIDVDTSLSEKEMGDMLMRQLVAAQARSEASNCHPKLERDELAALAEAAEVVEIDYAPEDWPGN